MRLQQPRQWFFLHHLITPLLFLDQLKSSSPINSFLQLVVSLLSSQSIQLQFFSSSILQHVIDHSKSNDPPSLSKNKTLFSPFS
ncbi:hypothetical protein GEMRC1_009339 [Eukaryota sp. GEM-RC1]